MALTLHSLHQETGATFGAILGQETVLHYGQSHAELPWFRATVALVDLSYRSRLCLLGADRQGFLNGQVTNNILTLTPGRGCYACLLNAKGKIDSDLNVHCLEEELLLDFEPGLTDAVRSRLEAYIIAEDVQVLDVAPHYGVLAVMGPLASKAVGVLLPSYDETSDPWTFQKLSHPDLGEVYAMRQPAPGVPAVQLYIPLPGLGTAAGILAGKVRALGGGWAGWDALEMLRVEAGVPRFGMDMDATNLPPEAGLEGRAVRYDKGCYIGQEIIARIRTYGRVSKSLRGFRLETGVDRLPKRGDPLFHEGKPVGYLTSALYSATLRASIALGYVRREHDQEGRRFALDADADADAGVAVQAPLPFVPTIPS